MAEIPIDWERAEREAEGIVPRVVIFRTGLVLTKDGGLLQQLLIPFKLGVGGPIAGGEQFMSWIHLDDEVGLLLWALDNERVSGTINATAPNPVTNREFSKALGRALHRPAFMPVPKFAVSAMRGASWPMRSPVGRAYCPGGHSTAATSSATRSSTRHSPARSAHKRAPNTTASLIAGAPLVKMEGVKLEGVHHITAITGDAQKNVDFYAGVLGLRLVKKTVNQDDPTVYHLFFADENGDAGSDLTFFEYPGAPPGRAGDGMIWGIRWRLGSSDALDFWSRAARGQRDAGRSSRDGVLRFADPEGLGHALKVVRDDRRAPDRRPPRHPR